MKLQRFGAILVTIALAAFVTGCEGPPTYIVYVDETPPCMFETWDGNEIEELVVYPKDRVVIANIGDKKLTITFQSNVIFGVDSVEINSHKRAILTVQDDASGEVKYSIVGASGCPISEPKVKTGDPP